jgi:hypothetical protein
LGAQLLVGLVAAQEANLSKARAQAPPVKVMMGVELAVLAVAVAARVQLAALAQAALVMVAQVATDLHPQ